MRARTHTHMSVCIYVNIYIYIEYMLVFASVSWTQQLLALQPVSASLLRGSRLVVSATGTVVAGLEGLR